MLSLEASQGADQAYLGKSHRYTQFLRLAFVCFDSCCNKKCLIGSFSWVASFRKSTLQMIIFSLHHCYLKLLVYQVLPIREKKYLVKSLSFWCWHIAIPIPIMEHYFPAVNWKNQCCAISWCKLIKFYSKKNYFCFYILFEMKLTFK